jgi:hypothetical protein
MIEDSLDMKTKVEGILRATNNLENRAAKMDVDDLLTCVLLLHAEVLLADSVVAYCRRFMRLVCTLHDCFLLLAVVHRFVFVA